MLDLHQHSGSGVYRASTGLSDSLPSWCPGRFVLLSSEILATGRALHALAPKPAPGAGSRGSSFVSPFTPPYGEASTEDAVAVLCPSPAAALSSAGTRGHHKPTLRGSAWPKPKFTPGLLPSPPQAIPGR